MIRQAYSKITRSQLKRAVAAILAVGCGVSGCASGSSLPKLSSVATSGLPTALMKSDKLFPTPPTETYALVARGATRCWFGAGPLQGSHVFHAEAESPSQGGRAVIVIHERDRSGASPQGLKAYRIVIQADSGGGSLVEQENLRFDTAMAEKLRRDAVRWAGGTPTCPSSSGEGGEMVSTPAASGATATAAGVVPVTLRGAR